MIHRHERGEPPRCARLTCRNLVTWHRGTWQLYCSVQCAGHCIGTRRRDRSAMQNANRIWRLKKQAERRQRLAGLLLDFAAGLIPVDQVYAEVDRQVNVGYQRGHIQGRREARAVHAA